jgi:hypothetical protein
MESTHRHAADFPGLTIAGRTATRTADAALAAALTVPAGRPAVSGPTGVGPAVPTVEMTAHGFAETDVVLITWAAGHAWAFVGPDSGANVFYPVGLTNSLPAVNTPLTVALATRVTDADALPVLPTASPTWQTTTTTAAAMIATLEEGTDPAPPFDPTLTILAEAIPPTPGAGEAGLTMPTGADQFLALAAAGQAAATVTLATLYDPP